MKILNQLNVEESVRLEKLVYKENWLNKIDTLAVYFIFGCFMVAPLLIYVGETRNQGHVGIFYYLLFVITIFGAYVIYRKATEKKLIKIISNFKLPDIKIRVSNYSREENFAEYRAFESVMVYTADADFNISSNFKIYYIFILKDNLVLFTIIKEQFKLNVPILFTHLKVKKDLTKMLNASHDKENVC